VDCERGKEWHSPVCAIRYCQYRSASLRVHLGGTDLRNTSLRTSAEFWQHVYETKHLAQPPRKVAHVSLAPSVSITLTGWRQSMTVLVRNVPFVGRPWLTLSCWRPVDQPRDFKERWVCHPWDICGLVYFGLRAHRTSHAAGEKPPLTNRTPLYLTFAMIMGGQLTPSRPNALMWRPSTINTSPTTQHATVLGSSATSPPFYSEPWQQQKYAHTADHEVMSQIREFFTVDILPRELHRNGNFFNEIHCLRLITPMPD